MNKLSEDEKRQIEQETSKAIKQLIQEKNSPGVHIAGNVEFNYLCKNCVINEVKKLNKTIDEISEEYKHLIKIKDEEITGLKELNRTLKEELKTIKKSNKSNKKI